MATSPTHEENTFNFKRMNVSQDTENRFVRIIPRLDIKGPNLVKCVHLEGLRVLGRPEDFSLKYCLEGADELLYIDLVASLYGRQNLHEIVSRTAAEISIPLTVGGGIRSVDDIRSLLRAGADKVAINTALFADPELVSRGARAFGSQCIVVSIQAKRLPDGSIRCMHTNARELTTWDVLDWARRVESLGAGEILLTSVDNEGCGQGYDLELTRTVSQAVNIPVIASGGAGTPEHIRQVIQEGHADAVCAASLFHYYRLQALTPRSAPEDEGNTAFLRLTRSASTRYLQDAIIPIGVAELKHYLADVGVACREALG